VEAQAEYAAWLDSLPDSLQDSATGDDPSVRQVCMLMAANRSGVERSSAWNRPL
jgi:hypothetical protein